MRFALLAIFALFSTVCADIADDLARVAAIDQAVARETLPFSNYFLQGGYLMMPSARMAPEGNVAFGYSSTPPYRNWSARVQLFENLEVTASYRIFDGIEDPVFGHMGFGEFSDKGASLKLALVKPEQSGYLLPGIALGWDDFLGTQSFTSKYIVVTQVFQKLGLECTFGYGIDRIEGFFGGVALHPFGKKSLQLTAEWDATNYADDPHPDGVEVKSRLNFGGKVAIGPYLDASLSYLKGKELAFAISGSYNLGETKGLFPKCADPCPYTFPRDREPIGPLRPEQVAAVEIVHALCEQGFQTLEIALEQSECAGKILRVRLVNRRWFFEEEVRRRLHHLFAHLTPDDIDEVRVALEADGFVAYELRYYASLLRGYHECAVGDAKLHLLTPFRCVSCSDPCRTQLLYKSSRCCLEWSVLPKVASYFGSTTGKYKYAAGASLGLRGYLPGDLYYQAQISYLALSSLSDVVGVDYLNPSQIINVHTDLVCYLKEKVPMIDQLFLQKSSNLGRGWFGRLAAGYFSTNYGGGALELLYFPPESSWAIGAEASILGKREVQGFGFTRTIRKFDGLEATYVPFIGYQYYLDIYRRFDPLEMDLRLSAGQFMARDYGVRTLLERTFDNGLRLIGWYTWTNGQDRVNGSLYHDKGIGISMPIDFFYQCSSRKRFTYKMSAWLRDVGYRTYVGPGLFESVRCLRE